MGSLLYLSRGLPQHGGIKGQKPRKGKRQRQFQAILPAFSTIRCRFSILLLLLGSLFIAFAATPLTLKNPISGLVAQGFGVGRCCRRDGTRFKIVDFKFVQPGSEKIKRDYQILRLIDHSADVDFPDRAAHK